MSQATMKVQPKTKDQQTGAHAVLTARRIVAYAVLILLCALCLFFFYVLIINATRPHADIQKGFSFLPGSWTSLCNNFTQVINNANIPILSGMRNSLIVSAMTAIFACYFSALTAFGIHAYRFKGRTLALTFILLIMTMPTQVSALGFLRLMTNMKLTDTLIPLFLPSIASPAVFYFMHQYMQASLPLEVIEAARIDGSSEFGTFNRIVLPMIKPALAVQAIFTFVASWNNYFVPALILTSNKKKTLPILIAQLRSADFLKFDMGQVYMLIAIAIMPVIIIVTLWMSMSTGFLSFVAGLQGVDRSQYEAGYVDGIRNRWQELYYITLPNMKPMLMFGAVMSITSAFGVCDVPMALAGFPSTDYAAHTVVTHLFDYGFTRFEMGYASAIATLLFLVMILCNKLIQSALRRIGT